MKIKEAVSLYKILGEAKVSSLEETEIVKIVKTRKLLRKYVEEYEAFFKDAQEKFKPDNFEETQSKIQKWNNLTDEEKIEVNKSIREYEAKINLAVNEESERVIDVTIETLTEDSVIKLLKHNDWSISKLDEMSAMLWLEMN